MAETRITLERLGELLDAYGAEPERWPDAEREAARRLVDESTAARARWEDAAELDRLLDAMPPAPPSRTLTRTVLAAAPRRRTPPVWRRTLWLAAPLAAAAAVTIWLAIDREPAHQVALSTPVQVGEYTSPTDVLLDSLAVDVLATVPSFGCADSALGCPDVEAPAKPYSGRQSSRRYRA